jgi:dTDP-4-amino-4,6-dideoxygalactose transaminase
VHLALDAIGLKAGDEVLVPTMTFAASAEVVLYFKAKPVLVDCRQDTMNIDPDQIEKPSPQRQNLLCPYRSAANPAAWIASLRSPEWATSR